MAGSLERTPRRRPAAGPGRREALEGKPPPQAGTPAAHPGAQTRTSLPEGPLVCARCAHPITHESQRTEVDGHHEHTRINPAGYVFHFGCFARADGCRLVGPPTAEHTWFAGFVWQYAYCASCRTHLGWSFHGPATFFGLLLERLARPS